MSKFATLKQELARYAFPAGISTSVLLEVSPPLRRVLQKIMRQGSMTFVELSEELDLEGDEATEIAELFIKCGFLKSSEKAPTGEVVFRICHTRSHRPDAPIAIWREMLDDMRDDINVTDTASTTDATDATVASVEEPSQAQAKSKPNDSDGSR
jgi:hypothetical protein